MASVSVMQMEPEHIGRVSTPYSPDHTSDLEYGHNEVQFHSASSHQSHAQQSGHTPWAAGYSSGYMSSSSNLHSPPVHTRSQSLDIDEAVLSGTNGGTDEWSDDRDDSENGWGHNGRESVASGWSNDREGGVSGMTNRQEYSSADNYQSAGLTLLPLYHLREGSYSRLDRSVSTTPTHSRQPSHASSHQSFQLHPNSDHASHQFRHSQSRNSHLSQDHASQHHASNLSQSHASHLSQSHASHLSQGRTSSQMGLPDHPLHRHSTSMVPGIHGNSSHEHSYTPQPVHASSSAYTGHRSHAELVQLPQASPDVPPHQWKYAPQQQSHPHTRQHSADAILSPISPSVDKPRPHPEGASFTAATPPFRRPKSVAASDQTLLDQVLGKLEEVDVDVKRWVVKADQHLQRSEFREAIPFVEAVIVRMQPYHRLQLLLWELLGNTHMAVSNWKKASICHLHHLGYSRALKDFKSATRAECNLGISYMKLDLLKLAGRCFLQYLKNCKTLHDEWGIQAACSNLGVLSKLAAIRSYEAASKCGGEEDWKEGETSARAKLNTGLLKAIIFFKQHLEAILDYGDLDMQSRAYGNIGSCYELLKDYTEAIHYHRKRLELARATGDLHTESCTLCHLGNCLRAKGNYEEAMEHYEMRLELARATGDLHTESQTLCHLGNCQRAKENYDEAVKYYEMNVEVAQKMKDVKMEENLHFLLGFMHEKMKQPHQAIVHYTLYLGTVVDQGELVKQVRGFSVLARLYMETGQLSNAHKYYHNLVGIFKQLGDKPSMNLAEMKARSLQQIIKQQQKKAKKLKKKNGKSSFSPAHLQVSMVKSNVRERGHTISRATNIHRELDGQYSGGAGQGNVQKKAGHSWGGTRRAINTGKHISNTARCVEHTGSSIELQDLRPQPDPPSSQQHQRMHQEVGYEAVNFSNGASQLHVSEMTTSSPRSSLTERPSLPLPTREPGSRDHSLSLDHLPLHGDDDINEVSFSSYESRHGHMTDRTTDCLTSVTSASLNNLDHLMQADLSVNPGHAQFPVSTQISSNAQFPRPQEEMSDDDCSTLYESITSSTHDCHNDFTEDHSMALPSLSYLSSSVDFERGGAAATTSFDDAGCGPVEEQNEEDISMRHFEELKQAGLELARVGLDLAGYDGLVGLNGLGMEEGVDKEWEQWQEMREEEIREGVAFGSSGHSTLQRKTKLKKTLRSADSVPSLAHRAR